MRVIDRSELILDIFARHARTQQARLQVELAQLQYEAPRLKRMWTHLSRIVGVGGIASRGPGEKQLEIDRRLVKAPHRGPAPRARARSRSGASGRCAAGPTRSRPRLVGYTNAGKSTLMNRLTGANVFVADRLFATLDTRTRKLEAGRGHARPRLGHGRVHQQAPAPPRRVVPRHARGGPERGPPAARRRRERSPGRREAAGRPKRPFGPRRGRHRGARRPQQGRSRVRPRRARGAARRGSRRPSSCPRRPGPESTPSTTRSARARCRARSS